MCLQGWNWMDGKVMNTFYISAEIWSNFTFKVKDFEQKKMARGGR